MPRFCGTAAPVIGTFSSLAFVIETSVSNRALLGPGPDAATGTRMRSNSSFERLWYRYALGRTIGAAMPVMVTVTSTLPAACGGAIATTSEKVFETMRPNASPNFTEVAHETPGQRSDEPCIPLLRRCTKSPPVVTPDAGRTAVTVTGVCAKRTGADKRKRYNP